MRLPRPGNSNNVEIFKNGNKNWKEYRSNLDYNKTSGLHGVISYVKIGNKIVTINQSLIDNIKIIVNKFDLVHIAHEHFKPGQKLMINAGPFAGFSGELVKYKGKNKVLARVELLNTNLLMDMPLCFVGNGESKRSI